MKNIVISLVFLIVLAGGFLGYQSTSTQVSQKEAIEQGIASFQQKSASELDATEKNLVRVQLALMDYIANYHRPPDTLEELVPTYFERLPLNPETNKPFKYTREGASYQLGDKTLLAAKKSSKDASEKKKQKPKEEDFLNPNTMKIEEFVYDPEGKRDPFVPFTYLEQKEVDESVPPLLRYDVAQLRVAAVLEQSGGGRFAMVEDGAGVGYPVRLGDRVGNRNGEVVAIEPKQVIVVEKFKDAAGQDQVERRTIEFVAGGADATKLRKGRGRKKRRRRR